jgi:hypothetical protein
MIDARAILMATALTALAAGGGCVSHAPRLVVADPGSVPARNDSYWKVRPHANAACNTPAAPAASANPCSLCRELVPPDAAEAYLASRCARH